MSAIALGVGLAGVAVNAYGANKQSKSVDAANATNDARLAEQNQSAWNAYLLSRGVNPAGAATGQLPTNPQPVNSKLPLWANVRRTTGGGYSASRPSAPSAGGGGSLGGRTWEGLGIRL